MNQVETLLLEICERTTDPLDYLDVQLLIEAGAGKPAIGFAYEAEGEERADRIAARLKVELANRLHGVLNLHQVLLQMSTSPLRPVLLGEWGVITDAIYGCCASSGKWLTVPEREDETLSSTLIVTVVIWLTSRDVLN